MQRKVLESDVGKKTKCSEIHPFATINPHFCYFFRRNLVIDLQHCFYTMQVASHNAPGQAKSS
jgi:hypothetical protein